MVARSVPGSWRRVCAVPDGISAVCPRIWLLIPSEVIVRPQGNELYKAGGTGLPVGLLRPTEYPDFCRLTR
ncbi:hypothetical protein chiPu_0007086 [Chiloscyllium punctatum]|uniref:Uncharacterized protein n=1 Tax=Chiloscyllium punctatum TaxID=137246 RepID=A0A401SE71_CHIPU|nr:hypothetical protein [Chiloscyllium punctatum]